MKMKTRDLAMVMENEALKKLAYKQFTTINKKPIQLCSTKRIAYWMRRTNL
jgi:hypothetical protein